MPLIAGRFHEYNNLATKIIINNNFCKMLFHLVNHDGAFILNYLLYFAVLEERYL